MFAVLYSLSVVNSLEKIEISADWTHVEVLLDRSGSMYSTKHDAMGGYNSMLFQMQKEHVSAKEKGHRLTWTLNQFNHDYAPGISTSIELVSELDDSNYHCSGNTALLDSAGTMLTNLEREMDGEDARVIVLVITDGLENASREWSKDALSKLVKNLENEKGWKFIFSAANQDAFQEGAKYGFTHSQTYGQNKKGFEKMWTKNSQLLSSCYSGTSADCNANYASFTQTEAENVIEFQEEVLEKTHQTEAEIRHRNEEENDEQKNFVEKTTIEKQEL